MLDPKIQEELKQKLLEEKKRLEENMAGYESSPKKPDREYQADFSEIERDEEANADEMEMYESNIATDEALKNELKKVEAALSAMEKGTYGFCKNCQKEIPLERLRAYPQADTCLDCLPR
jgi:RNA polymerase-binding protein DksA